MSGWIAAVGNGLTEVKTYWSVAEMEHFGSNGENLDHVAESETLPYLSLLMVSLSPPWICQNILQELSFPLRGTIRAGMIDFGDTLMIHF